MSQATTANEFLGHPKGLYVCFLTEMWERFAFYGMKALLFLYLTKYHLFNDSNGYLLLGTYAGLAYALPLLGGMIADRWLGMRKAVLFGGALLVLGQLGMAYTGNAATGSVGAAVQDQFAIQIMYLSLALIAVGVGFLKPNISTIVGRLYADGDPRRESGFTIFYMGINIGAALSSLIVAYIGENYGWGYGFALAGIMMALGLVQFMMGQKHLMGQAEPPNPSALTRGIEFSIYAIGLITTALVWIVLQTKIKLDALTQLAGGHEVTLTEIVAVAMGSALFIWFIFFLFSGITALERWRMVLLMLLISVSALFWGIYEQTYGTWVAFAERGMDRTTFGIEWTSGQTTFLGAMFVVLYSPIFAWLWPKLDKHGLNPSLTAKFGWALILCGLATGVLMLAAKSPGTDGLVSLWWMVAAYGVLVLGEMMLSPIGLSAVTTLSIPRVVGMMMGAWFLASAFGEMVAGRFGTWAEVKPNADGSYNIAEALGIYGNVFGDLMWYGVIAGVVLLVIAPLMKRFAKA